MINTFFLAMINFMKLLLGLIFVAVVSTTIVGLFVGCKNRKHIWKYINNKKKIYCSKSAFNVDLLYFVFGVLIFCIATVSLVLCRLSIFDCIKFVLFVVIYINLPGYSIARKFGKYYRSFPIVYTLSSVVGITFLMGTYIFGSFIGYLQIIYFVGPIMSIYSIVLLFLDKKMGRQVKTSKEDFKLLLVILSLLLYCAIVRGAYGLNPERSGLTSNFMDSLYIITNSVTLKGGLFNDSINFPGFLLRYHSGTNIIQACAGKITGISAVDIFMSYWHYLYVPLGCCAIYSLVTIVRKKEKNAALITLLVFASEIFTFTAFYPFNYSKIIENIYSGTGNLEAYFLILPNGNDLAIPSIITIAFVCVSFYRKEIKQAYSLVLLFLCTFNLTASKSVYGAIICASLIIVVLIAIIQRNDIKKILPDICMASVAIVSFLMVYFILIYNPNQKETSSISMLDLADSRNMIQYEKLHFYLGDIFTKIGLENIINSKSFLIINLLTSIFFVLPYVMIPFAIVLLKKIIRIKTDTKIDIFLLSISVISIVGNYFFNMDGYSQIYFLIAGICFIHIIGQIWICENFSNLRYIFKAFLIIMLTISVFYTTSYCLIRIQWVIPKYINISSKKINSTIEPTYDGITKYEYEGMKWLKNNTSTNCMILSDRFYLSPVDKDNQIKSIDNSLYFYYAAYSERQMYLGAYAYSPRTPEMATWINKRLDFVDEMYSSYSNNRGEKLVKKGIDYVIVSRIITQNDYLQNDPSLKNVYSNRDIKIYKVK